MPLLILLVLYATVPFELSYITAAKYDISVISGFAVNGVLWFVLLMNEIRRRAYSLEMMHWIFCLFFFAFAPTVQYIFKSFPWIGFVPDSILFRANFMLFIWTVCFFAGTRCKNLKAVFSKMFVINPQRLENLKQHMIFFTVLHIFFAAHKIITDGFVRIFMRGGVIKIQASSLNLLMSHCHTAFCALLVISCIIFMRYDKKYYLLCIINFLCLLINCFPTAISRYATAAVYGGIFITLFPNLKYNRKFIVIFIFAIVIVFPFLNAFRHEAIINVNIASAFSGTVNNISNVWNAGDYDAYTMFAMSIEHVDSFGSTHGCQLLGALLFWLPRIFWAAKPTGSGYFMAVSRGLRFANISAPLPAEGNINFGLIGVILFGLVFGAIAGSLDSKYWKNSSLNSQDYMYFEIIYPILMFMFFFMSRGDLMSPLSYTVSFAAVWFALGIF